MNKYLILLFVSFLMASCNECCDETDNSKEVANITSATMEKTINSLSQMHPAANVDLIAKGVKHAGSLWRNVDGTEAEFQNRG